ncbi:MAG: DoxX family protein [Pyrinomonadaceae bacterium]
MAISKGKNIGSWVLQVMVAGLFMMMAVPKLMSSADVVANFERWGLPGKMYLVIGAFEMLGAIGLLIPKTSALAAIGLIMIMMGALYTHLTHGEMLMAMMPVMVIMMLAFVIYVRNPFNKAVTALGGV